MKAVNERFGFLWKWIFEIGRPSVFFVLFFLILVISESFATERYIFSDPENIADISTKVEYVDAMQLDQSFETVTNFPDSLWEDLPSPPWFPNKASAYWLKFSIKNNTLKDVYLNIPYPFNFLMDVYISNGEPSQWKHYCGGMGSPSSYRMLPIHSYNYLAAKPGQVAEVYILIKNTWVTIPVIELASAESLYQKENIFLLSRGIYIGIICALWIYNFFIWLVLKRVIYLYYLAYLASVFFVCMHHSGLSCQYLWPCDQWLYLTSFVNSSVGIASIMFAQKFLNLKKYVPWLNKALWVVAFSYIFHITLFPLSLDVKNNLSWPSQLLEFNHSVVTIVLFLAGLYVYFIKKYAPVKYFLLGWTFFLSSSFFMFRIYGGQVEFNSIYFASLEYGSALEALLFSFALADSVRAINREKHQSELKQAELNAANTQLIDVNNKLEELVQLRTQSLSTSNTKLKKALEELDLFLYSSYHDIKGPIDRLKGLILVFEKDSGQNALEMFRSYFLKNIKEMEVLIEKIKTVNNLSNLEPNTETISVNNFLSPIVEKINPNDGSILIQVQEELEISTDLKLLEIVFRNILDNSLTYKSDTRACEIKISALESTNGINFSIVDNGDGIPSSVIDNIFKMFFRGNEKSNGHGLGLYLVKRALEKIEGTIEVESEEGVFTRVAFFVPNFRSPQ